MKLSGLHILLTYQCTFECEHCFVWGSPWQTGTLTMEQVKNILGQAKAAGIESIYFEGGEPFLYYALLVKGVDLAKQMGFHTGVVTNGYWANTVEDALEWLKPLRMLNDLSVSSDLYHFDEMMSHQAQVVVEAARRLEIPVGTISVAQPAETEAELAQGQIAEETPTEVMYRGRAARQLAPTAGHRSWKEFTTCPHEDLRAPGRIHLDPLGNLHICQGIVIGNLFKTPLNEVCASYDPENHPICGPLIIGGPVALANKYKIHHKYKYADACHLCYEMRLEIRRRFPEILQPDQVYGVNL